MLDIRLCDSWPSRRTSVSFEFFAMVFDVEISRFSVAFDGENNGRTAIIAKSIDGHRGGSSHRIARTGILAVLSLLK